MTAMNKIALAPTTLPDTKPLDYIDAAIAGGYDAVGLRLVKSPGLPYHPVLGDAPLIAEMKRRLAGSGLQVIDMLSCYLQPDTKVADFEPYLALGAELGASHVLTMGTDADWSRLVDNFAKFCDLAARYRLVATLEPAVHRPLASIKQSVQLARQSGRDNVAVCVDPLNFIRAGEKPDDLRAIDPKLLPYAQVSDGLLGPGEPDPALLGRMGPNQRRLIGEGVIPMTEILDALPAGIPLSIELPNQTDRVYAAGDWARVTVANVRGFLSGYYAAKARK
ncbi:MAG: sugar phosphate isomerase/epimerase [Alphaproteobacteria bacterium]|nr:sugar phosphate isomerase/epimerase [Alphaproteobacteria bacterium]MCA0450137.1 sugar phosphate isomerase/epimerase [Pseudomonadota bacterium]